MTPTPPTSRDSAARQKALVLIKDSMVRRGWTEYAEEDSAKVLDAALAEVRADERRRIQERMYAIPTQGKSALYFRAALDELLDRAALSGPADPTEDG